MCEGSEKITLEKLHRHRKNKKKKNAATRTLEKLEELYRNPQQARAVVKF